jgi:predicted pyridoxine 5'-phosphate oxidase superfamily flavin-nucleotide-binding protein
MDAWEEIAALLAAQDAAVLATVAEGRPHCSLMRYALAPDGAHIYLATLKSTRKWRNLQSNPAACLLVTEAGSSLGGTARALTVATRFAPFIDPSEAAEAALFLRAQLLERGAADAARLLDDPREGAVIRLAPVSYQLQRGVLESVFIDLEDGHA